TKFHTLHTFQLPKETTNPGQSSRQLPSGLHPPACDLFHARPRAPATAADSGCLLAECRSNTCRRSAASQSSLSRAILSTADGSARAPAKGRECSAYTPTARARTPAYRHCLNPLAIYMNRQSCAHESSLQQPPPSPSEAPLAQWSS